MIEGKLQIKGQTNSWDEVLQLCNSKQVVYRCQINGYPAYSTHWNDNWCVLYIPRPIN